MDIEDGDSLSHVRVYYTQKAGRAQQGNYNVTGVIVSTAKCVSKEVLRGGCEGVLSSDYYVNPLEEMVGLEIFHAFCLILGRLLTTHRTA